MVELNELMEKMLKDEPAPRLEVPKPEALTREGRMLAYSVKKAAPTLELFGDEVGKNLPIGAGYKGPGSQAIAEQLFHTIYAVSESRLYGTPDWSVTSKDGLSLYTQDYDDIARSTIYLTERDKDGKFVSRQPIELVTPEGALGKDFSKALHLYQAQRHLPYTDGIDERTLQYMRSDAINMTHQYHESAAKDAAPPIGGNLNTQGLDAFVRGHRSEEYDYQAQAFPHIPPRVLNAAATEKGVLSDREAASTAGSVEYSIRYLKEVVDPKKVSAVKKLVLDDDSYRLSTQEINGLQKFLGFKGDGGIGEDTLARLEGLRSAIGKAEIANGDANLTPAEVTQVVSEFLKTPATPSAKPAGKPAAAPKR